MEDHLKMTTQRYHLNSWLNFSEKGGRDNSLLQLIPEHIGVRALLPDLQHVLHQADGAIIGFVQFADDEQQIGAEGWHSCILPQQHRQVKKQTCTQGDCPGHCIYKLRSGTWQTFPSQPSEEPIQMAPWSWTSGLQNPEMIILIVEATQLVVLCFSSPSKLTQGLFLRFPRHTYHT